MFTIHYPMCSRRNQAKINLACVAGVRIGRERGFWAQEKRGVCARGEREENIFLKNDQETPETDQSGF